MAAPRKVAVDPPDMVVHEQTVADLEIDDVRADLETPVLAEVMREVISTYSLHILRNRPARISSRLANAVVETLLHGAIVSPTLSASRSKG